MISSDGDEFKDGGIYIGTAGNLYYYYKKIKYYEKLGDQEEMKEAIEAFELAFDTNLEVWKLQSMNKKSIPSFFMGMPGILTLAYLVFDEYGESTKAIQCLNRIADFTELPVEEAELLYGTAGFLYCLLLIKDYKPTLTKFDDAILHTTLNIIEHGLPVGYEKSNLKDALLHYEFPHGSGVDYLGAAHGYVGILYMILKALEFIPLQEIPNSIHRIVSNT